MKKLANPTSTKKQVKLWLLHRNEGD